MLRSPSSRILLCSSSSVQRLPISIALPGVHGMNTWSLPPCTVKMWPVVLTGSVFAPPVTSAPYADAATCAAWAAGLIAAFYGTVVASLAAFICLTGSSSRLGPSGRRWLLRLSGAGLALLGVYQVAVGVRGLSAA